MNWRAVKAILRRDLLAVSRSKGVLLPMIIVPLIFMVLLPAGVGFFAPALSRMPGANLPDMDRFLAMLPPELTARFGDYTTDQALIVFLLMYLFAPMFLIIPLMVASVIAADSFAGEKERKTLEALVYTPTTDLTLFAGKALSAMLPAIVVSLVGFLLFALTANLAAWQTMGRVFFPNLTWVLMVVWVGPAAAAMGLGATVLVSSRVSSFQEANQIAAVVVVPVLALVFSQVTGGLYFGPWVTAALGGLFWVIAGALLAVGVQTFRRGEIMAQG
jgi:ABC-2 type transport system permease protein